MIKLTKNNNHPEVRRSFDDNVFVLSNEQQKSLERTQAVIKENAAAQAKANAAPAVGHMVEHPLVTINAERVQAQNSDEALRPSQHAVEHLLTENATEDAQV